jgi:hypothetical protein
VVVTVGETEMLVPVPTRLFAAVYHCTVTGAVPVTPMDSVENPPELINDGLAVGCAAIAAGTQTVTVTSALLSVDVQELLTVAWYVVVTLGLTRMLAPVPTKAPEEVYH